MNALIPRPRGAIETTEPDPDSLHREVHPVFLAYRDVFAAECLPHRAVFWTEEKRGKLTLRHVRDLRRTRNADDTILGIAPDMDAVRVMIGNFADGLALSMARWEVYRDFGLTDLAAVGRFDRRDLLGCIGEDSVRRLTAARIVPTSPWDFDNLLLTHVCRDCRRIRNSRTLLYNPNVPCESCGADAGMQDKLEVGKQLIVRQPYDDHKLALHHAQVTEGEFPIVLLLDPAANGFAYLCATLRCYNGMEMMADKSPDLSERMGRLLRGNLFALLQSDLLLDGFRAFLASIGEDLSDWETLLGSMLRIGRWIRSPYDRESRDIGLNASVVQDLLPHGLNDLILAIHRWRCSSRPAATLERRTLS